MVNKKIQWKREDNIKELLLLLKKYRELTFKHLKTKLGVSDPTLTGYIKTLLKQKKIEDFHKPEDRRKTWYRIKPESAAKVNNSLGKYEAVKFIKTIPRPVYIYKKDKHRAIAAFSTTPATMNRKKWEAAVKKVVHGLPMRLFKVPKGTQKMAIVIMLEGEET